jgi:hypothetical protein
MSKEFFVIVIRSVNPHRVMNVMAKNASINEIAFVVDDNDNERALIVTTLDPLKLNKVVFREYDRSDEDDFKFIIANQRSPISSLRSDDDCMSVLVDLKLSGDYDDICRIFNV